MGERAAARSDDADVERRLAELDDLLGRLEQLPGPPGALALEAVAAVVETYGAALARVVSLADDSPGLTEALTADPLVGHLLLVHGLHPEPVDVRVRRALDEIGSRLGPHPADLQLVAVADGTAEVRVTGGGGCGAPSAAELDQALREVVLAAAPELADLRITEARAAAFVPLDSLLRAPARPGVPA